MGTEFSGTRFPFSIHPTDGVHNSDSGPGMGHIMDPYNVGAEQDGSRHRRLGADLHLRTVRRRLRDVLNGEQFTDEELCENESSDAAGAAAVAFSCGAEGPWCDSERLGAFWVWWLKEAIPEAWETAYREKVT